MNTTRLNYVIWFAVAIIFLIAIKIVVLQRPYPYADDWGFAHFLNPISWQHAVSWLFRAHVDHIIPIHKLLHSYVAIIFGYDFRYLIGFNLLIAMVSCFFLLESARLYRGHYVIGDLIIPLIIMNPGAGFMHWAFQFQFLSSIFFVSGFIYFYMLYQLNNSNIYQHKEIYLELAILFLILCIFCGLNGVIFSSIIGTIIIGYSIYQNEFIKHGIVLKTLFIILALLNIVSWIIWKPSGASSTSLSINFIFILELVFTMLRGSMVSFAKEYGLWKSMLVFVLFVSSIFLIYQDRKKLNDNIPLFAVLIASFLLIIAVSIGRSKNLEGKAYVASMIFHYGFLSVLLPIVSWIVISKFNNFFIKPLGIFLLGIFLVAYYYNYESRMKHYMMTREKTKEILIQLKSNTNVVDLVDKFTLNLTWKNSKIHKSYVVSALNTLRKYNVPMYTPSPPCSCSELKE